jgi:hypothetical protein
VNKNEEKESGNFLIQKKPGDDSFARGDKTKYETEPDLVRSFRNALRRQVGELLCFLKENQNVYIHFDFQGKGWHELMLDYVNDRIVDSFFQKSAHGLVMNKFLFKTIAGSATDDGINRLPDFDRTYGYRGRVFKDRDTALDLLYGINYSSRSTIKKNEIKIVILPKGDGLTPKTIERFFEHNKGVEPSEAVEMKELEINAEIISNTGALGSDDLFAFLDDHDEKSVSIAQFDFIFSKAGASTQPDTDMIEIASLDRSMLAEISEKIVSLRKKTQTARDILGGQPTINSSPKTPSNITILGAFNNIILDPSSAKKKYQNHLLRVLPQIYTDTYHQDPILLPALIENVEFRLRNGDSYFKDREYFNHLKFDFYFLVSIQNNGEAKLMNMKDSSSYRIGLQLGVLARPLANEINSFEKNYVGLLSRRIGTMTDVIRFANELRQKLVMHDKKYTSVRAASNAIAAEIQCMGSYNKDECAFGFFESYFAPFVKSEQSDATNEQQITAAQNGN